ncbi:magnesium transporter [Fuchsiella alkaliacetigena]|uniref:magnesium transporter n=1 Tax=Fuchsiella alkaliacetigena TaxID=957042 RepID=UPI00200A7309|nr:magnesium transporter [Fuchsiella alkaliacetigena]MCK8824006.1 magnesium transporter [Fuchsiella alkaliacetigena]
MKDKKKSKNFILLLKKYLKNEKKEELNDLIEEMHYSDLADIIRSFEIDIQLRFFKLVVSQHSAQILMELDQGIRREIINSLKLEELTDFFEELPLDDKLEMLNNLDDQYREKVLNSLEDKEEILKFLNFDPDSTANRMSSEFIKVPAESTVEEVIEMIRRQGESAEIIYYIYVVDEQAKLKGVLSLRELLLADHKSKITGIMNTKVISIEPGSDQERAAHLMAKYDLISLPVVDLDNHILGIITIDDIVDVIHEEGTEDIFKKSGITQFEQQETDFSSNLVYGSVAKVVKTRMPWLLFVLLGGLFAGGVIEAFEETLESIVALAFFIPVIMDMGGNVGTQSSTIFVRGVVLGHIDIKDFTKYFVKELATGASIGLISALALGISTYFWQQELLLSLTTSLALFFTIILASALGFVIPWLLIKLGFDSASASDPLITTLKDITGLLIYFGIANLLMGHLL